MSVVQIAGNAIGKMYRGRCDVSLCSWIRLALVVIMHISLGRSQSNEASVRLNQGVLTGLKVFPDYSRTPVYSFLGIPYAQPPMGDLRFSPPVAHVGWNRTLYARNFQAICPQPELNVYEESLSGYLYQSRMSENCLYLNVWTPENCLRFGDCPILAIVSGEEQTFDWARNRPTGLDLAVDGIVVVTIQYRSNIFGWLTTGHPSAPGNLGLMDQQMALLWIQVNGKKFGGNPRQTTLLGHGTSGATNAMIHFASMPQSRKYFHQLILMSGSVFSPWSFHVPRNPASPSSSVIRNLACESTNPISTLECLRQKSVTDLLQAFGNVYKNGNYTSLLTPEVDRYLEKKTQLISKDPRFVISQKNYTDMPIMLGICSNEGAFVRDHWLDLAREGYAALFKYTQDTLVPNIMHQYGMYGLGSEQIRQTINWRFFEQIPQTVPSLLDAIQRLQSETRFEQPFYETLKMLSRERVFDVSVNSQVTSAKLQSDMKLDDGLMEHRELSTLIDGNAKKSSSLLFAYAFQQGSTMDLRGHTNYFGGASHSSDLLFLMGPSLFQQIGRRKMTVTEERLCKKIRRYFVDFVKTGNPTPGRLFDAWQPYTSQHRFVQMLGQLESVADSNIDTTKTYLDRNKIQIAQMLNGNTDSADASVNAAQNPYTIENHRVDSAPNGKSYLPDDGDSPFYLALSRVSSFWDDLLPKMHRNLNNHEGRQSETSMQDLDAHDADTSTKYRHAFFSMLVLVCILLAMLGICLYILRRSHHTVDTSYL